MGKTKYLIERILKLDYKNMYSIAGTISNKANRKRFVILMDMAYCGLKYQAGYYDYQEFEFYNLNNKERKTYLTRGKNNQIIKKYNQREMFYVFDDKVIFNKKFNQFLNRDWMELKDSSIDDFKKFIKNKKSIMVKPIDGEGGQGVDKVVINSKTDLDKLYHKLIKNNQLLIEDFVIQHKDMNKLYDKSVNTIRMFTFCKDGQPHFLQAILKIGNGGVVDNFCSGGMYTFLDESGKVLVPAIDQDDNIFTKHPITKQEIVDFQVPMFKEAVKLVKDASKVIPEVGYVGWDVAISESGPVIIEGNCFPGVFQMKASFSKDKVGLLPKYKKVMDI